MVMLYSNILVLVKKETKPFHMNKYIQRVSNLYCRKLSIRYNMFQNLRNWWSTKLNTIIFFTFFYVFLLCQTNVETTEVFIAEQNNSCYLVFRHNSQWFVLLILLIVYYCFSPFNIQTFKTDSAGLGHQQKFKFC